MVSSIHDLHDSVYSTRRYSISVPDENSSYDDLLRVCSY